MADLTRLAVALDLSGQWVVVVGGGTVAERKVESLLATGAKVRVIAPELTSNLLAMSAARRLTWAARAYGPGDLAEARLAFAVTDRPEINEQVADEARSRGIFCNVAAPAESGDLHLMATIQREQVTLAIGTGGASPYAAARLKELVEQAVPHELAMLAGLMGELRAEVTEQVVGQAARRAVYERMWQSEAAAKLAAGDVDGARAILRDLVDGPANPTAPRPPGSGS